MREMRIHPDPKIATPFHDGVAIVAGQEVPSVMQIARSDLVKGTEVLAWPGWLSNSELILQHEQSFDKNPTGVGGNLTVPPNWSPRINTPNGREFAKFNCTSAGAFQMRFSTKGWPVRIFVRCTRIAFLLENDWYSADDLERIALLDQWPPTKKYTHKGWIGYTQADQQVGKVILTYCAAMKQRLKDTITTALADSFRNSSDAADKLLLKLRGDESRAFRECVTLAKSVEKS